MLRRLVVLSAFLVLSSPESGCAHAPPFSREVAAGQEAEFAFVHVSLVPMDRPGILEGRTVLVRGDRIVAVGADSTVVPGPRVRIIDGTGKFLLPGLADMHAHVFDRGALAAYVASGVTTVREMAGSPWTLRWRDDIIGGALVGPTLHVAGPVLDPYPSTWNGSLVVATAAQGRAAVADQHARGYEFVKVYNDLSPETYEGIVSEAQRLGIPVTGHVPKAVGLARAMHAQASIEHLSGYLPLLKRGDSFDMSELPALIEETRKSGVWNCPTLVNGEKVVPPEKLRALLAAPEARYESQAALARWDPERNYLREMKPADYQEARAGLAAKRTLVQRLHEAGAPLLAGTDAGDIATLHGASLHEELANFVRSGFTPWEAIHAATKEAADFAHDDFGVVAAGKRADLLLVNANPLADVGNLGKRAGVMVRGRWYDAGALAALLDDLARSRTAVGEQLDSMPALGTKHGSGEVRVFDAWVGKRHVGRERFVLENGSAPSARNALFTQATMDEELAVFESWPHAFRFESPDARLDLSPAGEPVAQVTKALTASGALTVTLTVKEGRTHLEVEPSDAHAPRQSDDGAFAPGAMFEPRGAGDWQVLVRRWQELKTGETRELLAKGVDLLPRAKLVDVTMHVERALDDGARRHYVVNLTRPSWKERVELYTDADGSLAEYDVARDNFAVHLRRAP